MLICNRHKRSPLNNDIAVIIVLKWNCFDDGKTVCPKTGRRKDEIQHLNA
jgi:hypothetical protein